MPIIAVKTIKKITLGLVNIIKLFNSLNINDIYWNFIIRDKKALKTLKAKVQTIMQHCIINWQ